MNTAFKTSLIMINTMILTLATLGTFALAPTAIACRNYTTNGGAGNPARDCPITNRDNNGKYILVDDCTNIFIDADSNPDGYYHYVDYGSFPCIEASEKACTGNASTGHKCKHWGTIVKGVGEAGNPTLTISGCQRDSNEPCAIW